MRTMLFVALSEITEEEFLAIAGTAEASSEHPLGMAVTKHAKEVINRLLFRTFALYTQERMGYFPPIYASLKQHL